MRRLRLRARNRTHQKGAVAVETAFSLIIMMTIVIAGIQFSDAIFIRQQLGASASRAARICALAPRNGYAGCVTAEAQRPLDARLNGRCAIQTASRIRAAGTLDIGEVTVSCVYNFDWLSGTLGDLGIGQLRMNAAAAMPLQTPRP